MDFLKFLIPSPIPFPISGKRLAPNKKIIVPALAFAFSLVENPATLEVLPEEPINLLVVRVAQDFFIFARFDIGTDDYDLPQHVTVPGFHRIHELGSGLQRWVVDKI